MEDLNAQISQLHSLEKGKGLQYLVNEAYRILGNPFLLHNMEYELIVCTENVVTDDFLWNEIVVTGVFSEESIKFFSEECFIDIVAGTESTAVLSSDKLKYERLYGRVFNNYNNTVADLIMMACEKPIGEHDIILFKTVCEKLSQEIKTCDFFRNYGNIYHEKLICRLLDTRIDDKVIYSDHLANLYEGLKTNLYVVVAAINKGNAAKNTLEEYRDLFKEMQPEFKYAVYLNHIVIIVSTEETELKVEKELQKLSGYLKDNNIFMGISISFDNLFDLRKYYNEAVDLLTKCLADLR